MGDTPPAAGELLSDAEVHRGGEPASVLLPGHDVPLGRYTTVHRLLPQRQRRMVGAWCFVDHFGPLPVAGRPGMRLPPHPHTGLQTVTWLVEGEMLHRDSLGNRQLVGPGQLNLMTAGHGITHSEDSPEVRPPTMHGLQLWVALPEPARHGPPRFAHHRDLPVLARDSTTTTVVVGTLAGARSPAEVHSPLVGAQIDVAPDGGTTLELEPRFEYAVLALDGAARVAGTDLTPGTLLYLEPGRTAAPLTSRAGARLFLLGGEPFDEPLVMWWNFVARDHEEIVTARQDWAAGRRFGRVADHPDAPLPAPELPTVRLKPRTRHGRILD